MKTLIVVDLTLSSEDELTQQILEQFADDLADLIASHGLNAGLGLSALVRLAVFDDDGNELSSGLGEELCQLVEAG